MRKCENLEFHFLSRPAKRPEAALFPTEYPYGFREILSRHQLAAPFFIWQGTGTVIPNTQPFVNAVAICCDVWRGFGPPLRPKEIDYNILFRWFAGLNLDDAVWHATTFSKNRDRLLRWV
jgi:hypothetical protein